MSRSTLSQPDQKATRADATLSVRANDETVGTLWQCSQGDWVFEYADAWRDTPNRFPISLSLPLTEKVHRGPLVESFFSNLLPDDPAALEQLTRRFNLPSEDRYRFLAAIGRDCAGAIQISLREIVQIPLRDQDPRSLEERDMEALLQSLRTSPLGLSGAEDFRVCLAGAQAKTALLWEEGRWCLPLGSTPTTHIVKVPIGSAAANTIDLSDSCENERLCLEIARSFGLPTARSELKSFGTQRAIVVERFDRRRSSKTGVILRLPTENFCQVLGVAPEKKYEADGGPGIKDIMKVLERSECAQKDREVLMKAQVLLWLIDSTDGHAKNYSIFLERDSRFRLAPLYDILSVAPLVAERTLSAHKVKLAMGLKGKNKHYRTKEIEPRHFVEESVACGLPRETIFRIFESFTEDTEAVLGSIKARLPADFPKTTAEPIFATLTQRIQKLRNFLALNGA